MFASIVVASMATSHASSYENNFLSDNILYGVEIGWGQTLDIPTCKNCPPPRQSQQFVSLITSYEKNLTGLTNQRSPLPGAWFWRIELGLATIMGDDATDGDRHLINLSPLMLQYRSFELEKNWHLKFLGGIGFGLTNWTDFGGQPLNSDSQFLVHAGVGIEFPNKETSYSIDYRLLHISNGGSGIPNIGINAHIISLTIPF